MCVGGRCSRRAGGRGGERGGLRGGEEALEELVGMCVGSRDVDVRGSKSDEVNISGSRREACIYGCCRFAPALPPLLWL